MASQENLPVDFRVVSAEQTSFADNSFEVITANQCWLYFDFNKAVAEVKRLLKQNDVLVISSFL